MRLPTDGTTMRGMYVDSAPRISWLVATTRLYADDPAVRRRDAFALALTACARSPAGTSISFAADSITVLVVASWAYCEARPLEASSVSFGVPFVGCIVISMTDEEEYDGTGTRAAK